MTSTELLRPLRSQAEAKADLAARDSADPWWRFRWARRRNPTLFQKCLAVHVAHATESKSALR